jgi:glutaredoxin
MQSSRPGSVPTRLNHRRLVFGAVFAALLALAGSSAHAQTVYRIVGPDGKVTFSDKPPVTAAKVSGLETTANPATTSNPALPYDLRQVVAKYPVTLYTSKDCAPCDSGRSLLRIRGVPFSEKTITTADDSESLQRISGSTSLPFLTLGGQHIKGFSDAEWTQYLGAAGYPESSKLPASYRNPPATPLVAVQLPTAPPAAQASAAAARPQPPTPTPPRVNSANPAGIQF